MKMAAAQISTLLPLGLTMRDARVKLMSSDVVQMEKLLPRVQVLRDVQDARLRSTDAVQTISPQQRALITWDASAQDLNLVAAQMVFLRHW